jgi:hypothetical protein
MQCPSCRTENAPAARFCHPCGLAFAPPRELDGERKQATILFADVVGSTAAAEAHRVDDAYGAAIIANRLAAGQLRLGRPEPALAQLGPARAEAARTLVGLGVVGAAHPVPRDPSPAARLAEA